MASHSQQTSALSERADGAQCLLCVDDHPEVLSIMGEFLRVFGYSVLTAPSGQRGLQLLQRNSVDAVILDYEMPKMDGAELAVQIKQRWPDLPVLMFTGYPSEVPDKIHRAVDAFVVKGEPADKLLQTLRELLPAGENGHTGKTAAKTRRTQISRKAGSSRRVRRSA